MTSPQPTPLISFVIPVRNDARRLDGCLRSIRANRYPADRIEVLVLDNGSVDDSPAVAASHGATVLSMPNLRLGEMRNEGVRRAAGEMVALVDADHEIVPDWIIGAVDALSGDGVGAVGAPYFPPRPGTWVQRLYGGLRSHPSGREPVEWLGSGNMALKQSAFVSVGGFDTSLETCEDVDLSRKLRAQGFGLFADARLGTIHHGDPATLKDVFFGELWRGRDNIRVSLRQPRSWRTLVTALIPITSLAALAMVVAGLLAGGRFRTALVSLGLLGVAGIVLLRSIRMARAARSPLDMLRAVCVAAAYEWGRALALAARFGYAKRRRDPVAA